jgi:L-asparaginase
MIGIELSGHSDKRGNVVADFNCGGMWRAWVDGREGKVKVMVFREEYV